MALGKNEILAARPSRWKVTLQNVEGLGEVFVAEMSVAELAGLQDVLTTEGDVRKLRSAVMGAVAVLADSDGNRLFANGDREQAAEAVLAHPKDVVLNLVRAVVRAQGVDSEAVKEAVGNSERGPSDASSSN